MSQFGSWLLLLGASCHQLPLFPLCAAPRRSPQPPCGHRLPATAVVASAVDAGAAAACSAASQPPEGLHWCCCVTVAVSQPIVCIPPTHTESGMWPEQGTLALPGPKNEEHLSFFMGY